MTSSSACAAVDADVPRPRVCRSRWQAFTSPDNALIQKRKSVKLSMPCSCARAPTMSSISITCFRSEAKSCAHALKVSGGVTATTSAHASTSSRSCLTLTTSVRCRLAPSLSVASRIIKMVSAKPFSVRASKSGRSYISMHACLRASRWPARLPLSTVEMYCGASERPSYRSLSSSTPIAARCSSAVPTPAARPSR